MFSLTWKNISIVEDYSLGLRRGTVDFSGTLREISLDYTREACVGDYVLVHVGFALIGTNRRKGRSGRTARAQANDSAKQDSAPRDRENPVPALIKLNLRSEDV